MSLTSIPIQNVRLNPMNMIGGDWWLVTAGNEERGYNTMTASWGHLGALWERPGRKAHLGLPTAVVYLRPQRYTKEFLDREELFTLSVFGKGYKKALAYLGAHSGRDGDKISSAGVTPIFGEGSTYFAEADMVFICRKLYHAPLFEEGFVDTSLIDHNYPQKDFHHMYVGEILTVLLQQKKEG